jgi:hypothetical protein
VSLAPVCAAVFLLAGCGDPTIQLATRSAPIVGGEPDDAPERYPGVVRVVMQRADGSRSACSGTLIQADPTTGAGHVLTAAHCVFADPGVAAIPVRKTPQQVQFGLTAASARIHSVTRTSLDPGWDVDTAPIPGFVSPVVSSYVHDLAVLEVQGVDAAFAATALTPAAASDPLPPAGTPLHIVGYGRVDESTHSTGRRRVDAPVLAILTAPRTGGRLIAVDQASGGMCFGDSGGPELVDRPDGTLSIVGVNSSVLSYRVATVCHGYAASSPVADGEETLLVPVLAGLEAAAPTGCLACAYHAQLPDGACAALDAQTGSEEALGLNACVGTRRFAECRAEHAAGADIYDRVRSCLETACAACSAAYRAQVECGFGMDGAGPCDACVVEQAECCDLASQCSVDADCGACVLDPRGAEGCATAPLFRQVRACLATRCAAACAGANAVLALAGGGTGQPDAGAEDAGSGDAGAPEAPDADDADLPDAATAEVGVPDAGTADVGVRDAGFRRDDDRPTPDAVLPADVPGTGGRASTGGDGGCATAGAAGRAGGWGSLVCLAALLAAVRRRAHIRRK